MTSYNRQSYISEAIESVQNSSYKNLELIIVDDGSSDDTVTIAKRYTEKDPRIFVYVNKKNLGDYPNRNLAASYAKGKYIMYVDSDDMILKDGFQMCIEAMEAFPFANIGMQFNDQIDPNPFYLNPQEVIQYHFLEKPCLMIGPGGTILRKSFFNEIGGYPEKYGPANDMYFNLKAASIAGILFLPFTFNFYRIHDGQEQNNKYAYLSSNFRYLKDALNELQLSLSDDERNWVLNKNRRRFLINLLYYIFKNKSIKKLFVAINEAQFKFIDFLKALVHPSIKR
jgi:glycosyltransferase involved in cell wall biosynthesis